MTLCYWSFFVSPTVVCFDTPLISNGKSKKKRRGIWLDFPSVPYNREALDGVNNGYSRTYNRYQVRSRTWKTLTFQFSVYYTEGPELRSINLQKIEPDPYIDAYCNTDTNGKVKIFHEQYALSSEENRADGRTKPGLFKPLVSLLETSIDTTTVSRCNYRTKYKWILKSIRVNNWLF